MISYLSLAIRKDTSQPGLQLFKILITASLITSFLPSVNARSGPRRRFDTYEASSYSSDLIDNGLLIVDGCFINRPYRISTIDEQIALNQSVWEFPQILPSQVGNGMRRPLATTEPRWPRLRTERGRSVLAIRKARQISSALEEGRVVILNAESSMVTLDLSESTYQFYDAILTGNISDQQLEILNRIMSKEETREQWDQSLYLLVPDEGLRKLLRVRINSLTNGDERNIQEAHALLRLERMSYPLTTSGMFLAVVALWNVFRWPRKPGRQSVAHSIRKYSIVAMWMILGMSCVDLVWTILAYQAGVMREVNPLASLFISSPLQLAVFKITATGVGLGILYFWRHRTQAQHATWWMSLVCVLLTFRWVVFDQM